VLRALAAALASWRPPEAAVGAAARPLWPALLAYLAGTAWELSSHPAAAAALCSAGVVEALLVAAAQVAPLALSDGARQSQLQCAARDPHRPPSSTMPLASH
jgi:hypothetical protein